jgi:hypothetical protein
MLWLFFMWALMRLQKSKQDLAMSVLELATAHFFFGTLSGLLF